MPDQHNCRTQYSATPGKLQADQQLVRTPGAIASPSVPATTTSVPPFQFSVLTCARSLLATKTIYADGKEAPFGHAKNFLFKYCEIEILEDFAKALEWMADEPRRFIIRGQLKPGLDTNERHRRLLKPDGDTQATIECPPRRWVPLDIDGVRVPVGLGAPDRMAEAAYWVRDHMLPSMFRGIQCVASATSSTGREGLCTARLRLFFMLTEAVENELLYAWLENLNKKCPFIDHSVCQAQQPIYTARPLFVWCDDPVPKWGRVWVLDGYEETIAPELPRVRKSKSSASSVLPAIHPLGDVSAEYLEICDQYAGSGVYEVETSDKAWSAIKRIFEKLDGCPKGNDRGRHAELRDAAWELVHLAAEGELTVDLAEKSYFTAAEGINNYDKKYDAAAIQERWDDACARC